MKRLIFFFPLIALFLYSCDKNEQSQTAQPKEYIVSVGCAGEITDVAIEDLTKVGGSNDLYAIQVYSGDKKYAYGLFSSLDGVNIRLFEGTKYKFVATLVKDGATLLYHSDNQYDLPFTLSSGKASIGTDFHYAGDVFYTDVTLGFSKLNSTSEVYAHPNLDRFYGEVSDYTPSDEGRVMIDLKRVSFGLKAVAENMDEGSLCIKMNGAPEMVLSYPETQIEDIFSFTSVYHAWSMNNFQESETISFSWKKTNGEEIPIASDRFVFYRNKRTTITVKVFGTNNNITVSPETTPMSDGENYVIDSPSSAPASIAIDGNFSDWDSLTAETADGRNCIYSENTNPNLNSLLRLKLTSDQDYIYVYTEINWDYIYCAEGGPYQQGNGWYGFLPNHPGTPGPLTVYIGCDGDNTGAFAAPKAGSQTSMWDYCGFDAYPEFFFLYDVAADRMQFGWNGNLWPQNHSSIDWGATISEGDGWWGDDIEGSTLWDNLVSDENTFKFSLPTRVVDPVSEQEVNAIKLEFAMDREMILEEQTKIKGNVTIGVSYGNRGNNATWNSSIVSGKLPSDDTALTLLLY